MAPIESPLGTLWVAWNGRGVSEVELADERRRGRGPPRGADRPPDDARRCAAGPAGGPRSAAASPGRPGCGSRSTCAAAPSSRSRSGRRRWRSRAARSGRTAGSRPRSAGRRRSGPWARRWATTRCRSSSPATASSGPTARSASTASAGRATSARSSPPRGWIPRRSRTRRGAASGWRLHDDADRVLADVPPRAPGPGPLPGLVPIAPRGAGEGLPAVQGVPADGGRAAADVGASGGGRNRPATWPNRTSTSRRSAGYTPPPRPPPPELR